MDTIDSISQHQDIGHNGQYSQYSYNGNGQYSHNIKFKILDKTAEIFKVRVSFIIYVISK